MDEAILQAQTLALFILTWHQEIGRDLIHPNDSQFAQEYLSKLEYLQTLDLDKPEHLRQIAQTQTQGIFEHFYNQPVSENLWAIHVQPKFPLLSPHENLGAVAALLRNLLDNLVDAEKAASTFALPGGWHNTAFPLQPSFTRIPIKTEGMRKALRGFFGPLALLENKGIGGRELMVAMNEDLSENHSLGKDYIAVYSPASFDFQLATGDDCLITHMINGFVTVEVILGASF